MHIFVRLIKDEKGKLILLSLLSLIVSFIINVYGVAKVGFNNNLDDYYILYSIVSFAISAVFWPISNFCINKVIDGELSCSDVISIYRLYGIFSIPFVVLITLIFYQLNANRELNWYLFAFFIIFHVVDIFYNFLQVQYQSNDDFLTFMTYSTLSVFSQLLFVYFTVEKIGVYSLILSLIFSKFVFLFLSINKIRYKENTRMSPVYYVFNETKVFSLSSCYVKSGEVIDRFIMSSMSAGLLSSLAFSQRLSGAVSTVINSSMISPSITKLSHCEEKLDRYRELYTRVIYCLFFVFIIYSGWFLVGESLIKFIISMSNDSHVYYEDIFNFTLFLLFLALVNPVSNMLNNYLIVIGKVRNMSILDSFSYTFGIVLKFTFSIFWGAYGLVYALVLEATLKVLLKVIFISKVN
ncbi:hypothetical protein ACN930_002018 [Vibrio parahaemolyticus]|uniref:hypothetical protein n=1 Tax=Vibrio harveyi group TaxID=717610 RepID=UPI00186A0E6E|nr:hypothetical protein [Vibrio harveyi]EGR0931772.1 hypothetical protein [Vibrio parahaemolyticus]EHR7288616.1 hypothetical protein [Vibrio parahaemolyticus]EJG1803860.1 hypothetical protein [Vibrio parahaemolyticus]EJL7821360.1 hypothetical protein [Vibrio parahaemolyticus]MBE3760134.1 hypothetical protein [Vibrio parahaemolyticus]